MSVPENPLVIVAALWFDAGLTFSGVLAVLETRLQPFARFRQRVIEPPLGVGPPRWQEVPGFELAQHVQREAARGRELAEILSELSSAPLDRTRPLWMAHWIEGLAGGGVLVIRLHHSLGDGAALVSLLFALSDEGGADRGSHSGIWARPAPASSRMRQLAGWGRALGSALHRKDRALARRGPLGVRKVAVVSDALALAPLLTSARRQHTTLTVLLLAAVAGALRELRLAHPSDALHALVPVNLRAHPSASTNQFASISVPLPAAKAERLGRVGALRAELSALESFAHAQVWARLAELAGFATPRLARYAARVMSRKSTVVVSSVKGPPAVLHWRGARLSDICVLAPAPGNIALSVTLISYAGRARVSALADARAADDPRALLRSIEAELAALERELGAAASVDSSSER